MVICIKVKCGIATIKKAIKFILKIPKVKKFGMSITVIIKKYIPKTLPAMKRGASMTAKEE